MIEIKEASKIFHADTSQQTVALNNVNLKINRGEFLVLVGNNGSGKSTLLNAIAGTTSITSGKIFFDDNDVTSLHDYERSKWVARIFQNPLTGTAPDLTVLDNFRMAAMRTKNKSLQTGLTKKFVESVKEKVFSLNLGLENKLHNKMGSLSGGQRQALTLLMAVMDNCKILLMDEPTAALDPRSAEAVMSIAQKLIEENNLTTILVTHNMKDAHLFGNRIIQMSEGKILRDFSLSEKNKLRVTDLFGWFA
jgi:putative ABC transport system ATP-binding protein